MGLKLTGNEMSEATTETLFQVGRESIAHSENHFDVYTSDLQTHKNPLVALMQLQANVDTLSNLHKKLKFMNFRKYISGN